MQHRSGCDKIIIHGGIGSIQEGKVAYCLAVRYDIFSCSRIQEDLNLRVFDLLSPHAKGCANLGNTLF